MVSIVKKSISLLALVFIFAACQNSNPSSAPVVTPSSTTTAFVTPADAPRCMHGMHFKSRDEMCERLSGGFDQCQVQERYEYFNLRCSKKHHWQDRH
jgi:hypothetical protein